MLRHCLLHTTLIVLFSGILSAQQPGADFPRNIALSAQFPFAANPFEPAARGLDSNYYNNIDSLRAKSYKKLRITPFASIAIGSDIASDRVVSPSFAGLEISYRPNKRWFAQAGYAVAGGYLPAYLQSSADSLRFIPGFGYAVSDDRPNLYHAHYAYGKIAYSAGKHFQFEAGRGKHFWGDGHRSLVLSDNAAPAPYARITTSVWKLRYTNLWMQLRDISSMQSLAQARIKYAAMHALSIDITPKLNLSLMEWVIWQNQDTMSNRTLDLYYINPLIFYRPVEYTLGSPDNVILAAALRWDAAKNLRFYGQFVLDEFNLKLFKKDNNWWGNKIGGQLGLIWKPIEELTVLSEVNAVRPFTYSHGSSIQAWTHINQSMAHPLGANFLESCNSLHWRQGKWSVHEQFNVAFYGRDSDADGDGALDNFGGNLIRSYRDPFGGPFGHELLQGDRRKLMFHAFTLSRLIHADLGLELFLNHTYRFESGPAFEAVDHLLMVGIRTSGLLRPVQDY